jgi:hypothetical protein
MHSARTGSPAAARRRSLAGFLAFAPCQFRLRAPRGLSATVSHTDAPSPVPYGGPPPFRSGRVEYRVEERLNVQIDERVLTACGRRVDLSPAPSSENTRHGSSENARRGTESAPYSGLSTRQPITTLSSGALISENARRDWFWAAQIPSQARVRAAARRSKRIFSEAGFFREHRRPSHPLSVATWRVGTHNFRSGSVPAKVGSDQSSGCLAGALRYPSRPSLFGTANS